MASDSSDLSVSYFDGLGQDLNINKDKKPESSDTDMYLGLLANDNKVVEKEKEESSEISMDSEKDTTSVLSDSHSVRSSRSKHSRKSKKSSHRSVASSISDSSRRSSRSHKNFDYKHNLSKQESKLRKIELLRKLSEIKAKGYKLSKDYDFSSSIEEMEYEYELLKSFADKRNGIKLYKNVLVNVASAIEFMNDRYDPFDFQLGGWSEHLSVEVDSYEEVLEELYEKYKGTGKSMPAELKLLLLLVASASAFHFSKATLGNMGQQVFKNNPDIISRMINPKKEKSQFMTQQEIHLEKLKEQNMNQKQQLVQEAKDFSNFAPVPKASESLQSQTQVKAPDSVADILSRLHKNAAESVDEDTQEELTSSHNDRIVSESTLDSDTATSKKRGRKKKKKSIMSIM